MSDWFDNSQDESEDIPTSLPVVAIVGVVLSTLVLAHGFAKSRLKFKPVRICTDIAAMSTLISSILVLIHMQSPNKKSNAVICELMVTGLLNWFTQLADNTVFYLGYAAATHNVAKWKLWVVIAYGVVVMSISWMPTYTINPVFVDTNSTAYFNAYYTPGQLIYTWGNVLYNLYFTGEFAIILYKVYYLKIKQYSQAAQIVSIKCILHFFTR